MARKISRKKNPPRSRKVFADRVRSTVGYAEDGTRLQIPENRVMSHEPGHGYVPLRGYASNMAVLVAGRCVGWIDSRDLGFNTVKDWIRSRDVEENPPRKSSHPWLCMTCMFKLHKSGTEYQRMTEYSADRYPCDRCGHKLQLSLVNIKN